DRYEKCRIIAADGASLKTGNSRALLEWDGTKGAGGGRGQVPSGPSPFGGRSDDEDVETGREADDRNAARRRTPFVRDVAFVSHVGDLLRDVAVVQFLRAVDFGARRHAGDVDVAAQV